MPGRDGIRVVVDYVFADAPPRGGTLSLDACIARTKYIRRSYRGSNAVFSDQHAAEALRQQFATAGIILVVEPWTLASKVHAYALTRSVAHRWPARAPA